MYSYGDLLSHPFPRFVFDQLAYLPSDRHSRVDICKIRAIQAISRCQLDALLEALTDLWQTGDRLASVASVFQAAYRVASSHDVVEMVRPAMTALDKVYANKTQIQRLENALTRCVTDLHQVLNESTDLLVKHVVLLSNSDIKKGHHNISEVIVSSSDAYPKEKIGVPFVIDSDSSVDLSDSERTLTAWQSRVQNTQLDFRVYEAPSCITTAWMPTPMIDSGSVLAVTSSGLEHYHHARWIGATVVNSEVHEHVNEAAILPRTGTGYHYHHVVDHLASILALESAGLKRKTILVPDDLQKFNGVLKRAGVEPSRVRIYSKESSIRVTSPTLVPIAHHSRAKLLEARERIVIKPGLRRKKSKIYISRANARDRRLVNEAEIEEIVKEAGYKIVRLENMSMDDQIDVVDSATAIVAPHGGGLANLLFARKPLKLLELMSESYLVDFFYRMAVECDFSYTMYIGSRDLSIEGKRFNGAWRIDACRFKGALAKFDAL